MAKVKSNGQRKLNKKTIVIFGLCIFALCICSLVLKEKSFFAKGTGSNNQATVAMPDGTTPGVTTNVDVVMKETIIPLSVGEKYQLSYEGVSYSTNACTIAYVDETGLIEGISEGTTSVVLKKDGKICQ